MIAQSAYYQTRTQFRQDRQLVLEGAFVDPKGLYGCSTIQASPISKEFKFQGGTAYLPPQMYSQVVPIANNGDFMHMGSVCSYLSKYTKTKVSAKKDNVTVGQGVVPLIINSFYAVKGESYTDTSLYVLDTMMIVYDKEYQEPKILFSGLSFVQRLPPDAPIDPKALDDLINNPNGFTIKPKSP